MSPQGWNAARLGEADDSVRVSGERSAKRTGVQQHAGLRLRFGNPPGEKEPFLYKSRGAVQYLCGSGT